MSLTQALATSLSGLQATQKSLSIVAGNVANAQTPGYIAQSVVQVATSSGDGGAGVNVTSINRLLDQFVQQQLRSETSGGGYADLRATFYQQLQQIYGQPGSGTSLDSTFNGFTTAAQALSTSPGSSAAQSQAVAAAQALAQQLNNATNGIQTLRSQADQGIAGDVQQANNALQQIASINQQLAASSSADSSSALLENQRDQYIDQLSKLMDIRVVQGSNNQVSVFTGSGAQLVGSQAAQLNFTPTGTITAAQQWNADPTKSGLGTITLVSPAGDSVDLVASGAIRSGEIAGYLNMRDTVLVQAQGQLDEIAAQMSKALSDTTTAGTAVAGGFDADIGSLSNGNTIHVSYTDGSNVQHNITIVRVDDPSALPLSNTATTDPNDTVIGVDFSGGPASVAAQLNTALGATGLQFSNPSGATLEVVDSGSPAITVNAVSTTATATSLTGRVGRAAAFPRRHVGLHRRDYRGRIAEHGLCRTDHGQQRVGRRPLEARHLPNVTGNAVRRRDPAELHLQPARQFVAAIFAGGGHWRRRFAVPRDAAGLYQPDDQHAEHRGQRGDQPASGPGHRRQRAPVAIQFDLGGQYRHRNGELADIAEYLRSECAGDVDGQGDAGCLDADVM